MPTAITTRVEDYLVHEIDEVAREEAMGRSCVIRKFLLLSLQEWKIDKSLEKYDKGRITLWKAARDCGISLWEMIEEVKKRGIRVPYRMEDFQEDLKAL